MAVSAFHALRTLPVICSKGARYYLSNVHEAVTSPQFDVSNAPCNLPKLQHLAFIAQVGVVCSASVLDITVIDVAS